MHSKLKRKKIILAEFATKRCSNIAPRKVYRHITDNKEEDKDRVALKESLTEKVKKLAPKAPNPAAF
jgi:hypothetical protein